LGSGFRCSRSFASLSFCPGNELKSEIVVLLSRAFFSSVFACPRSSTIPPHHPLSLIDAVEARLEAILQKRERCERGAGGVDHEGREEGQEEGAAASRQVRLEPWFRGFTGQVRRLEKGGDDDLKTDRFLVQGRAKVLEKPKKGDAAGVEVEVTELPVGKWTNDYKEWLVQLVESGDLVTFVESHSATAPHFTLTLSREKYSALTMPQLDGAAGHGAADEAGSEVAEVSEAGSEIAEVSEAGSDGIVSPRLLRFLRLETTLSTANMVCVGADGATLKRYADAHEIIDDFFPVRLAMYVERKRHLEARLRSRAHAAAERAQFVDAVLNKKIDLSAGLPATEIREQLRALGIGNAPRAGAGAGAGAGIGTEKQDTAAGDARRAALLALPLSSLSRERVDFAAAEVEKTHDALRELEATTPEAMWLADLAALRRALEAHADMKTAAPGGLAK